MAQEKRALKPKRTPEQRARMIADLEEDIRTGRVYRQPSDPFEAEIGYAEDEPDEKHVCRFARKKKPAPGEEDLLHCTCGRTVDTKAYPDPITGRPVHGERPTSRKES